MWCCFVWFGVFVSSLYPSSPDGSDLVVVAAVNALSEGMKDGFGRVEARLGEVVTQGEFRATVQRLEGVDAALRAGLGEAREAHLADIALVRAEGSAREGEFRRVREEERVRFRWLVTVLVAGAGVVSGLVSSVVGWVS